MDILYITPYYVSDLIRILLNITEMEKLERLNEIKSVLFDFQEVHYFYFHITVLVLEYDIDMVIKNITIINLIQHKKG